MCADETKAGRRDSVRQYGEARRALDNGDYPLAIAGFQRLLALEPDSAVVWTGLGAALQFQGRYWEARACYEKAIVFDPRLVDAHSNLGTVLQGLRRLDEAMASFRAALDIDPRHLDALAGVAALLDQQGRYVEGIEMLKPVMARGARHSEILVSYGRLLRNVGRLEEATVLLERALGLGGHGPAARQRMHFLLGALHDELAHYDEAFAHYRRGNELKPIAFDAAAYRRGVDAILEVCTRETLAVLPRAAAIRGPRPLFMVGMPRSGSSLVEQILAAHRAVHGAGELDIVSILAARLQRPYGAKAPWPRGMRSLTAGTLDRMSADFWRAAALPASGVECVTDKTTGNFLYLGLIEMLFPHARVIHCRRNALDACLSCFFQDFAGGSLPFSYDLAHIGEYYREYARLMRHWREASALPILDIAYEDLIANQESATRALLEFACLDWDPRCLRFHEVERIVMTASNAQVRKPLYRSSIGRHRHYERHLRPLKQALEGA